MLVDQTASMESKAITENMAARGLSRRGFLAAGMAAGGGLLMTVALPPLNGVAEAAQPRQFAPDAYIRIGRDGRMTLIVPYTEMGQGTYTSISMLVAEELEVGLDQFQVEAAPADAKLYAHPLFGDQITGGSGSIRGAWEPMRRAGAAARMMLVAAAAEMWKVNRSACHVEKGAVIHAATGRRAEYGELADRAATLPVPTTIVLKDPKDFKLIGTPAKRLDSAAKVNGTARFGIDVQLRGMKIATLAICPVFGGKLAHVDDSKALAVKGVRQVVRVEEAVAVVADHMGAAKKGLAAVNVVWDEGKNAHLSTADLTARIEAAAENSGIVAEKEGDVERAMNEAASRFQADYRLPLLAHTTMEPLNCTVHVRKDACDVWVGNQSPARAKAVAVSVTGLPPQNVTVHNYLIGGGFGRRLDVDYIELAVRIAKQIDGPVKVVWSREEDIQHDSYRGHNFSRVAVGLDPQGMPLAFSHRVVGPSIMARFLPVFFKDGVDLDIVEGATGPYAFPNTRVEFVRHEAPAGLLTGNWRGVGPTRNMAVIEGIIDELAVKAGKDPVEYRRNLLGKSPRARAVLDMAVERADWGKPMPAGSGRGVALLLGFGTYMAQVAEVSVDKDGLVHVKRVVCAVDCGIVVNPDTVAAQIQGGIIYGLTAALYGQITIRNGRVEQGNFDTYQALRINEAPKVEVHIIKSSEAPGGMGEPGTAAIAPAVINAVFAATGQRLRALPIDSEKLKST